MIAVLSGAARTPAAGAGGGGGGGSFRANRPAGLTNVRQVDFSQTPVTNSPNSFQLGTTGWFQDFFNSDWTTLTDATAPVSPSTVWQGTFKAGSYNEVHNIPSSGPFTIACNFPSNFGTNVEVRNLTAGDVSMTPVASSPTTGQYIAPAVNSSGTYTFAAADAGVQVELSYEFGNTTGLTGSTAYGTGGGHDIGKLYCADMAGSPHVYFSGIVYFDMPDATYWQSISSKFITMFVNGPSGGPTDGGTALVQAFQGSEYLECNAEEGSGANILPSNNTAIPLKQYNEIEMWFDITNTTWKVWLNGALQTSSTSVPFVCTTVAEFDVVTFRGGGGEMLAHDLSWRLDDFLVAW